MNLQPHTIDLWQWDLNESQWDEFNGALSADEHARAQCFRGTILQSRYRRCRSVVRLILSKYLAYPTEAIRFSYNSYGKPAVTNGALHFNISHSNNVAMLAVSTQPLGVDIECHARTNIDVNSLYDWVCHAEETQRLSALSPTERQRAFYKLWTQKEAFYKALGKGLQTQLTEIRIVSIGGYYGVEGKNMHSSTPFFIHDLTAPLGYQASLCSAEKKPLLVYKSPTLGA